VKIASFEITKIGPTFRDMDKPFSRCFADLSLADEGDDAQSMISFNIVYRGSDSETLEARKTKILAECVRLLKEGANLLEGTTVQSLYKTTDSESRQLGLR
jgi:hypothetical protein